MDGDCSVDKNIHKAIQRSVIPGTFQMDQNLSWYVGVNVHCNDMGDLHMFKCTDEYWDCSQTYVVIRAISVAR